MDVLNRLVALHKPLGVYSIKEDTNIYRELSAYAQAFEELLGALAETEQEGFLLTAKEYGLENFESIYGPVMDELSEDKRRKMIFARCSLSISDFTSASLVKILKALGVEGTFREYPAVFRLTVHINGEYPLARRRFIAAQLKALLPAHLETDPVFEGFSFKDVDERGITFGEMEQKGMCWADIDIYCKD